MSSPEAFSGIETYLTANWTATPLVFENPQDPTPADQPAHFLFVEIVGNAFDQVSIGADPTISNRWREWGQIFLHVMTKNGIGSRQARVFAKQALDLFRGNEDAGIRPRGMSIGAGEPGVPIANYFAMTAIVDFEKDHD